MCFDEVAGYYGVAGMIDEWYWTSIFVHARLRETTLKQSLAS